MTSLDEILHYLDTTARVSCPSITCEQAAEIAALLRDRQLLPVGEAIGGVRALDIHRQYDCDHGCGCGVSHCAEYDGQEGECLACLADRKESDCSVLAHVACGFAWDAGREMALKDDTLGELAQRSMRDKESNAILLECVADLERDKERRERIEAGLSVEANTTTWEEATGDIDPGIYEGTGAGFEK